MLGAACSRPASDSSPPASSSEPPRRRVISFLPETPPSARDGEGSVVLSPEDPVRAGSWGTWTIAWTAGPSGLERGGSIALQISPFWGWSAPQHDRPGEPGYTTIDAGGKAQLEWSRAATPHSIVATLQEGRLRAGDRVRFVYGDSAKGGKGSLARADLYAEEFEELLIRTDFEGDGVFQLVKNQPTIRILAGDVQRLAVAAPAIVEPNTRFDVRVTALDARGSWAPLPRGRLTIRARSLATGEDATKEAILLDSFLEEGARAFADRRVRIPSGLYRIEASLQEEVEGDSPEGEAYSGANDLVLAEEGGAFSNILWGDLHIHSALSDGTGSPEELYRFARDVAGLDVASVTDHDAHGIEPLAVNWERIRQATEAAYEPGSFVTILGYEWTSWTWGHRNVYYPALEGDVFEFRGTESDTPQELWDKIAPFGGMTIPHHPGGGPIPIDWSIPSLESRETVVEICSIHGSSEAPGVERGIYDPIPGRSVRDAFSLGHRLGIIASGDTHDGHPGKRTSGASANGLVAFRAERRDRESVFACLRERRVYGTSGPRILLRSTWGGERAGAILPKAPRGTIDVRVVAPEPVESIELIGDPGVVDRAYGGGRRVERSFTIDGAALRWLYVRVALADGEVAWDSPWWIGAQSR